MMFRGLPPFGAEPRVVAEVVNNLLRGKSNNTGRVTLATGNATTTTFYDPNISPDSVIVLVPVSAASFTDAGPYGSFQDSTDQTAAAIDAAYAITFDTTDYANGISVVSNSRLTVTSAGIYNIQFSIQFKNTTNATQDVYVWLRKNGTDLSATNSRFGLMPRKNATDPSHLIAALNFFVNLAANDYVQLMWATTDIGCSIEQYPAVTYSAGVTPAMPATPSAVVTMDYVSSNGSNAADDYSVYVSSQGFGTATLTHFANSTADKTYAYIVVG